jgi:hypothetical protein
MLCVVAAPRPTVAEMLRDLKRRASEDQKEKTAAAKRLREATKEVAAATRLRNKSQKAADRGKDIARK